MQRGFESYGINARRTYAARQSDDVGCFDAGGTDDAQIVKWRSPFCARGVEQRRFEFESCEAGLCDTHRLSMCPRGEISSTGE